MESYNRLSEPEGKKPDFFQSFIEDRHRRGIFIAALIIILVISGLLIWKAMQIEQLKEQAKKDQDALWEQAQQSVLNAHIQHLKLLAKPYTWAARTEMIRGNMAGINDYANDMIKEKNFQRIIIADGNGKIISSTNKKFEGKEFTSVGKESYLTGDTTVVDKAGSNLLIVSSPIMGYNDRLGTLMINYSVPILVRDSTGDLVLP